MQELTSIMQSNNFLPILIFVIMGILGLVAIVFGCTVTMVKGKAKEASRREIAAYVAEGSITPDDAERLMNAGESACVKKT